MMGSSDARALLVDSAPSRHELQLELTRGARKMRAASAVPVRKPANLPRRFIEPVETDKTNLESGDDLPLELPSAFEQCLELAKVMVSPKGLSMKKVTLEGFTIPVALRLVVRRQQQRLVRHSSGAGSDGLSITWLDQDTFGFDVRGITSIRRGENVQDDDSGRAGESRVMLGGPGLNKINQCAGGGDDHHAQREAGSHDVVLSWSDGGGPAEVVFKAASSKQRDLVASTLEMMLAGIKVAEKTASADEAPESSTVWGDKGQTWVQNVVVARHHTCADLEQPIDSSVASTSVDAKDQPQTPKKEQAVVAAPGFSSSAGADNSATAFPPDNSFAPGAGACMDNSSSGAAPSNHAAATRILEHRAMGIEDSRTLGNRGPNRPMHSRGGSFSAAPSANLFCSSPRAKTLSRTRGMSEGPESLRQLGQGEEEEEEEEEQGRRQDAMARLLLVYDRAKDESVAAGWRHGAVKLKRLLSGAVAALKENAWAAWCEAVREANEERLKADRRMWFLHAKANQDNDLLAWYHATFFREVYRRRVPFWFRETQLKPYQTAYRIVDDGDTLNPVERSLMKSCVCTAETTYTDVATQLFMAKGVLDVEEYRLFQTLVKRGAEVPKAAPRSGRRFPYPMTIRLWFNGGSLCLTAKRNKPNSASRKDHSFYLSKIKNCLLALPASRGAGGESGSGSGSASGASSDGRTRGRRSGPCGVDLVAPVGEGKSDPGGVERFADSSGASDLMSPGAPEACSIDGDGTVGTGGWSLPPSSPSIGIGSSSPLPSPVAQDQLVNRDGDVGLAGVTAGSRALQDVGHDEADRGAGGMGGSGAVADAGAREGGGVKQPSRSGEAPVVPQSASVGDPLAASAADGVCMLSSSLRHRLPEHRPQERVLSVHFFGRTKTLDLWFATEKEAVQWQGTLTKLSLKEQGHLYGGDSSGGGGSGGGGSGGDEDGDEDEI